MELINKEALAKEIKKRYEYWREKELNSHSIESEIRMSECQHLMLLFNTLEVKEINLTNAFIEKAIGWIDYNNRNGGCNFCKWEEDFRNYMEGE